MKKRKNLLVYIMLIVIVFFFIGGYGAYFFDFPFKKYFDTISLYIKKSDLVNKNKPLNKERKEKKLSETLFTLAGSINVNPSKDYDESYYYSINGFNEISQILVNDDITLSSLNFPKEEKEYTNTQALYKYLKDNSIEALDINSLYNNTTEINKLSKYGLNLLSSKESLSFNVNNSFIKILSYTEPKEDYNFFNQLFKDVALSKKNNNIVIVIFQVNGEINYSLMDELSKSSINKGADLVILDNMDYNSIDKYENRFIIKSHGAILDTENKVNNNEYNYLFQTSFVTDGPKLIALGIKAIPYKLLESKGIKYPSLLKDVEKQEALKNINTINGFNISDKFNFIEFN